MRIMLLKSMALHEKGRELSDKDQRRVDYEAACIAEKEYYERRELGRVKTKSTKVKLKVAAVCTPSNVSYLRRNRWIKGVDMYFSRK